MRFTKAASRLPVELITMVMNHVDLAQLVQLSHVCRYWRPIARSHPLFWRVIELSGVSTTALDFFQARLDQAGDREIVVDLRLSDCEDFKPIRSVVLPAVARCLSQMMQLAVDVHHGVAESALAALHGPAPRLKAIALHFSHYPDDRPMVLLNADMLAGSCPMLLGVTLENVALPPTPITAFDCVQSLLYQSFVPGPIQTHLLNHFPALKNLALTGETCTRINLGERHTELLEKLKLDTLDVHFSDSRYNELFAAWFPGLEAIPHVICRRPRRAVAETLLGHLSGTLELAFVCPFEGCIHIAFSMPASRRTRTFPQWDMHILKDWPHRAIFSPAILPRITALRLDETLTDLIPHFGAMPECTTLTLVLLDKPALIICDELDEKTQTTWLPALASLVLTPRGRRRRQPAPIRDLHAFLLRLLGRRAKRLTLRIDGVDVSGDARILADDFDGV